MTEETFKMMKEKGAWFIMQPILNDEDSMAFPAGSPQDKNFFGVTKGTAQGIQMARKLDVKTAFGTDLIFNPVAAKNMAIANNVSVNAKGTRRCHWQ
jgi:imidazolonepropionase-like amidohydrolase